MKQTWTQLTLALLSVLPALAQSNDGRIAFEAATVKVNKSGGSAPEKERILPGGRIELSNATLKELIVPIYGFKANLIIGGPKWIDSTRFDIVAKAAPDTPVPALLKMVQALLEDQFKLTFHHEDKVMAVYALVIAKDGPKLRLAAPGGRQNCRSQPSEVGGVRMVHRECHNITMTELVRQLGLGGYGIDDRPVVDATHLSGTYDFEFEYTRPRNAAGPGDGDRAGDAAAAPDLAGPTIFDSMKQLGLRLEASKQTIPVMVIDRAEQPPE